MFIFPQFLASFKSSFSQYLPKITQNHRLPPTTDESLSEDSAFKSSDPESKPSDIRKQRSSRPPFSNFWPFNGVMEPRKMEIKF